MTRSTLLVALLLMGSLLAAAPTASAEPCEVPGCNLGAAAACYAQHAVKHTSAWKQWTRDCLIQPA